MAVARKPNALFDPLVAATELLLEETPPPPIVMA
jgi:hypothetical protein